MKRFTGTLPQELEIKLRDENYNSILKEKINHKDIKELAGLLKRLGNCGVDLDKAYKMTKKVKGESWW